MYSIMVLRTKASHDLFELLCGDRPTAVFVEHFERLPELGVRITVLSLLDHHGQELLEVNGAVAVGVDFGDLEQSG